MSPAADDLHVLIVDAIRTGRALEREACALVCYEVARELDCDGPTCDALALVAERIRARR